jgi:CRISPR/Cas system Type II protein with McrA/HNH and RuvC-like nuclease domain
MFPTCVGMNRRYGKGMEKTITTTHKMTSKTANKNRAENSNGMNWIRITKRLSIYLRDGLSCGYCGQSVENGAKLTLDHIVPHSKNGSNHETNLITACSTCNSARGNRPIIEFIAGVAHYLNMDADKIVDHINTSKERKLMKDEAVAMIDRRCSPRVCG